MGFAKLRCPFFGGAPHLRKEILEPVHLRKSPYPPKYLHGNPLGPQEPVQVPGPSGANPLQVNSCWVAVRNLFMKLP